MKTTINIPQERTTSRKWLLLVFVLYVVVSAIAIQHHEMWADELHSWNIARGSASFADLLHNNRFEGHPPAWLLLNWSLSKYSHNPVCMQFSQWIIAIAVVYVLLFHTRLPLMARLLLPFGYYFLFEYGVLSRNYALGVLFALLICVIMDKDFRGKTLLYYALLFVMSNVHLLSLLLAGSLHLYFLMIMKEHQRSNSRMLAHVIVALLVFAPAMWFIAAPSGSGPTVAILVQKLGFSRVAIAGQAPVRAFLPLPAWWQYHFWNTQVLLELKDRYRVLKFVIPIVSMLLVIAAAVLLRRDRKSMVLFLANVFVTFLVSIIFSLHTERYVGFIFIGFVVACVLYCKTAFFSAGGRKSLTALLLIQACSGLLAVARDFQYPFSQAGKAVSLTANLPVAARVVTDYRALNAVVAYLPKPLYCIDMEETLPFILWNTDMQLLTRYKNRYDHGLQRYFNEQRCNEVYMISNGNASVLSATDSMLFSNWQVSLVRAETRSIEPESNLYLYKITRH